MNKLFLLPVAALGITASAHAYLQIDLVAAAAPNVYSSPNYQQWFDNAVTGLRNNQQTVGSGHSTYTNVSGTTRDVTEAAVTEFQSWDGTADTGDGEYGQRMHFVFRVYDTTGADVDLHSIGAIDVVGVWRDGHEDHLGPYDYDGSFSFNGFSRIGFLGDGTAVTSGDGPVKQIIGTFGFAYEPDFDATGTNQEILDDLLAQMADPNTGLASIDATMTYDDGSVHRTRTQFVNFQANAVPEPTTLAALGLGALSLMRRRRKG